MLEFKKAGINDLLKIQKIAYETWPSTFRQLMTTEQINYMLDLIYNEESLKKQVLEKRHNFILAEKDHHALGFTSYEIQYNSQPELMIHKIYLLPASQGLGIGTKFLNLLSDVALHNNNKRLRLKVYFENSKAIGFYEKYGFKNIGTEAIDIGNNYCILDKIMVKEL